MDAKAELEAAGYVVVKARTYRNLQEKLRGERAEVEYQKQRNDDTRRWAERAFDEQRRLADRLTFVYGMARSAGLSVEDLSGDL